MVFALGAIPLVRSWTRGPLPEPPSVARVSGAAETQWSDDGAPDDDGGVPAGRRLDLRQGLAQIAFQGGAVVILQGPAVLEPESPDAGRLARGGLVARIPPQAAGFLIRTPWATVVDRGTEFGVRVQPDGLSDVEVFRGQVEVVAKDEGGRMKDETAGPDRPLPPAPCPLPTLLRAGEALRVSPPVAGASPHPSSFLLPPSSLGQGHFARSMGGSVARLQALVATDPHLLHHYTFEGLTPAQECRDRRGDLPLYEVAMSGGSGGGRIDYSAPGPDPSAWAVRPFRAAAMGNSHGVGLESQIPFHPPPAMTVELLLSFGEKGTVPFCPEAGAASRESHKWGLSPFPAGMISAAVATRQGPCGFLIAALDDGRLVQLLDGRAPWLETGVKFQPGRWYYVAGTFRVEARQTIVNTYVADLTPGRRTLQWVVRDEAVPGVPAAGCLGVGHGFDGENGRAYPWPGALGELAIYAAVLDRDALQSHLDAAVGEPPAAAEPAPQ
jgi:hypothetical protein